MGHPKNAVSFVNARRSKDSDMDIAPKQGNSAAG
jgi:hypothetical protein